MQVAMILAVLTGVEIVIIWLPFGFWSIFWPLFILSVAKFVYVIVYFMHLRWDRALCTILFLLGLVIAGLTAWALHALFGDNPYDPVADGRLPVSTEMVATA